MSYLHALLPLLYEALTPIGFATAGLGVLIGLLSIVSPPHFERLCDLANTWIKTPCQSPQIDKPIADPESFVRRHVRATGMLILVLAIMLGLTINQL